MWTFSVYLTNEATILGKSVDVTLQTCPVEMAAWGRARNLWFHFGSVHTASPISITASLSVMVYGTETKRRHLFWVLKKSGLILEGKAVKWPGLNSSYRCKIAPISAIPSIGSLGLILRLRKDLLHGLIGLIGFIRNWALLLPLWKKRKALSSNTWINKRLFENFWYSFRQNGV